MSYLMRSCLALSINSLKQKVNNMQSNWQTVGATALEDQCGLQTEARKSLIRLDAG